MDVNHLLCDHFAIDINTQIWIITLYTWSSYKCYVNYISVCFFKLISKRVWLGDKCWSCLGTCSVEPGRAPSFSRGSGGAEAAAAGPGVFRINCQSWESPPVVLVIVSPGSEPVSPLPKGWFGIIFEVLRGGEGMSNFCWSWLLVRNFCHHSLILFPVSLTFYLHSEDISVTVVSGE